MWQKFIEQPYVWATFIREKINAAFFFIGRLLRERCLFCDCRERKPGDQDSFRIKERRNFY